MQGETNFWYDSGIWSPLPGQLENGTWANFSPIPFLKNNNINVPIQKVSRWYEWFVSEEKGCNNDSTAYFNDGVDNSIIDSEGKACGIIAIPSIGITFDNENIHVLHDLPKLYIYGF